MIDVQVLLFDDENEAKFLRNGITATEVQQVFDKWPRYYVNRGGRRASHVMIGPTRRGDVLVVPIERTSIGAEDEGIWRPVTAFKATPSQTVRYRRGS